ncbi:MAG TPA: hypothetical protein VEQ59_18540 [Polyangiaceae bacterium]|nr:hypothetical protein [Polyangiaceae bacterium]
MGEKAASKARSAHVPWALLCLAALSSACGTDEARGAAAPRTIPGCEMLDLSLCDTRQRECQTSRLAIAACLRETEPGALPQVSVMNEQEYVDYWNAQFEGKQSNKTNHFEVAMTWLGLAQPGSFGFVPLQAADVSDWFGTYRWRQEDLLLIDHGRPADDEASNVELVGALVRALRDRDIDISAWSTAVWIIDEDGRWGADAMYFGEARLYSNRYKAALEGLDPAAFDEMASIGDGIREDVAWIRAQPSSYVASNDRFPDNFGARFAYLAWQRGGAAGIDGLYDTYLLTHQLMASETEEGPPPSLKHHDLPVAPAAWESGNVTAIGAWGLFLTLNRSLSSDAAWALSLDWRGDQVYVFKGVEPTDETALVWQLEMADEAAATALEAELGSADPEARIQRDGSFVTLAKTTNDDSLEWAFTN